MEAAVDYGKTALTQNVTRLCALWLDAKGFKPVETEVSLGVSRGWIADLAGVIVPTQTECIDLKLIRHPPRYDWQRRESPGFLEKYKEKQSAWNAEYQKIPGILTALIEVKTSVADFRRDLKWSLDGSPTNLKYLAMPRGMIDESRWPKGWGMLLYGQSQAELIGPNAGILRCVRPSPIYDVSIEQSRSAILQIAIRRDNVTRYAHLRKLSQEIRISDNERKSLARISNAISFLLKIADGNTIDEARRWSGIRSELPPYLVERIEEFRQRCEPSNRPQQTVPTPQASQTVSTDSRDSQK